MEYLNSSNVASILEKVGRIVEIEESIVEGHILRSFIRAKVQLDDTKPLPSNCWIPRKSLPKIWAIYKYERLQDPCFNCGILRHEQRTCKTPKVMSAYCSSIPKYDQNLSAQVPKSITTILQEHRKRYIDTTNGTPQKFQFNKAPAANPPYQQQSNTSSEVESEAITCENAKKAWEEMVANCSEGKRTIPTRMGKSFSHLQLRDKSSEIPHHFPYEEENQDYALTEEYPMPYEAYLTDKEFEEYHKQQQHQLMPTRVPLSFDQICPGVGPRTLEELQLVEKDVGLAKPMISRDCPSPSDDKTRYGGENISFLEVLSIKTKIQAADVSNMEYKRVIG